jgi:ubiquinone/menaquinone biosynthesis C-methylase UbiE
VTNPHVRVCPVERAGSLDSRIRRFLQNPRRILGPYVKEGMTVVDLGCGPGFFTIDLAEMVGESGRVIAADLQEGMLEKLRRKIQGAALGGRITLHRCEPNRIGVPPGVDLVLAFYVVHEFPDATPLFEEIRSILNPDGRMLIVEPPLHVSRRAFEAMLQKARDAGLVPVEPPRMRVNKIVILKRNQP